MFSRGSLFQKPGTMDTRPRFGRPASFKQGGLATTPAKDSGSQGMDSPEKGGHSLRKRTRVNYATEQIEDEVVVPNSTSTARGRKRKLDVGFDDIDSLYGPRGKRRGVSLGADTPSTRRRNPARKSSEIAPFRPFDEDHYGNDDDDDEDIQDTIEVGLSTSDVTDDEDDEDDEDDDEEDDEEDGEETKEPVISGEATETLIDPESTPVPAPLPKAEEAEVASPQATPTKSTNLPANLQPSPNQESVHKEEAPTSPPKPIDDAHVPKSEADDLEAPQDSAPVHETNVPEDTLDEKDAPVPDEMANIETKSADGIAEMSAGAEPQAPSTDPGTQDATTTSDVIKTPRSPSIPAPSTPPAAQAAQPVKGQPEDSLPAAEPETVPSEVNEVARKESLLEQPDDLPQWAYLRPWVKDQWTVYPEKLARSDDDAASEAPSQDDKDASKDINDALAAVDENAETPAVVVTEDPTPAQNTPTRGSPAPEVADLTAPTSPAPAGEEPDEAESSEVQQPQWKTKQYRYQTLPDAETFIREIDNYADMSSADLYNMLLVVNEAMVDWERQYYNCNKIIDDYENAERRRIADAKYEARTRNLNQHGVNYEESELIMKGYKAKDKEGSSETRYHQAQDRIMAAAYGFEYDNHPSKIGRQNPAAQQAGITTRGRSLRNQPRQTAKATESDVAVTGKRQRKPVQLFDPAPQEESRGSTPVPARRRRRNVNAENDDSQTNFTNSFQTEGSPDIDAPPSGGRRKRVRKAAPRIVEESATLTPSHDASAQDEQVKTSGRRGRPKATHRTDDVDSVRPSIENELQQSEPVPTRMLTLKIPKGTHIVSGPSSAITDNGESRPSTAGSDSTAHTVESSYSFRPKRQKRFRDAPSDTEEVTPEEPPKKKKRTINIVKKRASPGDLASAEPEAGASHTGPSQNGPETSSRKGKGKAAKAKDDESRNGTPMSQQTDGGDEPPKDYSTMTKSEKMSASMRSKFRIFPSRMCSFQNLLTRFCQTAGRTATCKRPSRNARQR